MDLSFDIRLQSNLPDPGMDQMEKEKECFKTMKIHLDKKETNGLSGLVLAARIVEVHSHDHRGISPCVFEYSVSDYAKVNGRNIFVGRGEYNSTNLRKRL